MSYLFQGDALFDSLSAWDNVAFPLRESRGLTRRAIADKVAPLLKKLDLADVGRKFPSELSGGMRRRVALARALIVDPDIVLFDEPTSGLDPLRRNAVLELIHRDSRRFGFTALVVSHDVPESLFIADHAAILDDGVIAAEGTPEDLIDGMDAASPLHGFLHNEEDLVGRLNLAIPEQAWKTKEKSIREQFDTLALFSFPRKLEELDLGAQLREVCIRRNVLESVCRLGPHVSSAHALPGQQAFIGFKGMDPEVTSSILFALPELSACSRPDASVRIALGPSRPDLSFDEQRESLQNSPVQYFRMNPRTTC